MNDINAGINVKENYTPYIIAGLVLTFLAVVGLAIYSLSESTRLVQAHDEFTNERVTRGLEIYQAQCVSCHGANGEGGVGPALKNKALLKSTQDDLFFSLIRSGVPNTQMPAWSIDYGGPLTDEDVRDVVALMRSWEATAPEIKPVVFEPDAGRGAVLFANTCAVCHGENGQGGKSAPKLNDPQRLQAFADDWYSAVIRNGRPAKGMPTWGTVLSPNQVSDLVALIGSWRAGEQVQAEYSVTGLLDSAIFSLENADPGSADLHVQRALQVATGAAQEVLRNAASQLASSDAAGALVTLQALRQEWPLGDAVAGGDLYKTSCAVCHGPQGEGGIGKPLKPNEFTQSQTNAQMVEFLLAGRPGTAMAGFKDRLTDAQLADIVAFLRLWQK